MTREQLLSILDDVGGLVNEAEILYQAAQRNGSSSPVSIIDELHQLEVEGKVIFRTYWSSDLVGKDES